VSGSVHNEEMPTVVLVEGTSDQCALVTLASRLGCDLDAAHVSVVSMDGATNIGHFLRRHPLEVNLAGLYDVGEERLVRRALERAGRATDGTSEGLEALGFYRCVADLEDELIRALGTDTVEQVVAAQGEMGSFRTFQKQPAKRTVPIEAQLRRFLGTTSGRKLHYARVLVEALDLRRVPPPLDRLLVRVAT
jgi:Overcoming lysogenization defect protein-like, TOPRIM domain